MKSTAWLPILVLVAVVLATGFSWWFSSPDREYLYDGERGLARPEVADWWTIRVPVAFAVGLIACGTLIVLLRSARSGAWAEGVASIAVAVLGVSTLAGSMVLVRQRLDSGPVESKRLTPTMASEIFNRSQWDDLASLPIPSVRSTAKPKHRRGPLRKGGVGLKGDYAGFIPFDPFLLDRVSFVGLTAADVEKLLGPPLPERIPNPASMTYQMLGFSIHNARARLILVTGTYFAPSETVESEYIMFP